MFGFFVVVIVVVVCNDVLQQQVLLMTDVLDRFACSWKKCILLLIVFSVRFDAFQDINRSLLIETSLSFVNMRDAMYIL